MSLLQKSPIITTKCIHMFTIRYGMSLILCHIWKSHHQVKIIPRTSCYHVVVMMTLSYVWHAAFRLLYSTQFETSSRSDLSVLPKCNMTHSHVWHAAFRLLYSTQFVISNCPDLSPSPICDIIHPYKHEILWRKKIITNLEFSKSQP